MEVDSYQKKLSEILNSIYTNKEFLMSVFQKERRNMQSVKKVFADIIRYYIMSRDEHIYDNYEQICKKEAEFDERIPNRINDGKLNMNFREEYDEWYNEICERIDTNGYITHSFYGKEGDLIRKYGLNYTKYWNDEEKNEYINAQQALVRLLDFFSNTRYKVDPYHTVKFKPSKIPSLDLRLIYFTTPGDTTFLYTLDASPTILYEQLLKGYISELEDLKGKTKKEKIREILNTRANNLDYLYLDTNEEELKQNYLEQLASGDIDKVVDYYCDGNQGFALVRIADIRNLGIKLGVGDWGETGNNKYSFDELIAKEEERFIEIRRRRGMVEHVKGTPRKNLHYPRDFFSSDAISRTFSCFENFYAEAEDLDQIPVECVLCIDAFDIIKIKQEIEDRENGER